MAAKDHTPHLRVRIDPKLLERLEKSRAKNGRTLTGEIVERLEESFRRDDSAAQIGEITKQIEEFAKVFREAGLRRLEKKSEKSPPPTSGTKGG
jgi:hypothetical protein